jgi:hypothetical protein
MSVYSLSLFFFLLLFQKESFLRGFTLDKSLLTLASHLTIFSDIISRIAERTPYRARDFEPIMSAASIIQQSSAALQETLAAEVRLHDLEFLSRLLIGYESVMQESLTQNSARSFIYHGPLECTQFKSAWAFVFTDLLVLTVPHGQADEEPTGEPSRPMAPPPLARQCSVLLAAAPTAVIHPSPQDSLHAPLTALTADAHTGSSPIATLEGRHLKVGEAHDVLAIVHLKPEVEVEKDHLKPSLILRTTTTELRLLPDATEDVDLWLRVLDRSGGVRVLVNVCVCVCLKMRERVCVCA